MKGRWMQGECLVLVLVLVVSSLMSVADAEARVSAYGQRGVVVGPNGSVVAGRQAVVVHDDRRVRVNNTRVVVERDDGPSTGAVVGAAIAGAAVGAAVASAHHAPAVGTVVTVLPATGCSSVILDGLRVQRCGSVWYQPVFRGTTVSYRVVRID